MESTYFGPATKAAVIKFQAKNGVNPAVGYVGPITRQAITAVCGTTGGGSTGGNTGGSGTLQGGEGQLLINSVLGDVETDVDEGDEDAKVLGAEVEADDSDIMIERVDVDITIGSGGSAALDNYIDEVSLWLGSTKLASQDADEGDEDSNDVFSFRFTGLKGVINEGDEENLYVAVTAINNVDSGDTDVTLDIDIPTNGIRAVDAAGISETYVDGSPTLDGGFSVTAATAGDLDISENDANPEGQVVGIDEDEDTDDVLVLAFDLEANSQDLVIDAIPVGLTSAGEDAGIDGPVKRAVLKMDGEVIDTVSITATASVNQEVLFNDLNIDLSDGDTAEFEVYVDLNDHDASTFATGTTLYATTTGSDSDWDVEDANGDNITPDGAIDNSGDTLVFHTDGVEVELVSVDTSIIFAGETAGQQQVGEFVIVVDVTAVGTDIYIDKSSNEDGDRDGSDSAGDGFLWATTSESTTGTTTIADTVTASGSTSGDTSTAFKISEGQTRRFTLNVTLVGQADGVAAVQMTGINWDIDSGDSTGDNFYNSNMSDFKTGLQTLLVI
jgi:hypothetical protein